MQEGRRKGGQIAGLHRVVARGPLKFRPVAPARRSLPTLDHVPSVARLSVLHPF
jgi:hypothetical protein